LDARSFPSGSHLHYLVLYLDDRGDPALGRRTRLPGRCTAQGMSPPVTPPIHVDVGGAAEPGFRLIVAGARESVTVSGAPARVETDPSAVSTLLDGRAQRYPAQRGPSSREEFWFAGLEPDREKR